MLCFKITIKFLDRTYRYNVYVMYVIHESIRWGKYDKHVQSTIMYVGTMNIILLDSLNGDEFAWA